ncbi:MAG: pilus assembly protein, partial [Betaproteobacteria bacterium]|nr:pilus assembly protein [Betaproteobacteria bacterium]
MHSHDMPGIRSLIYPAFLCLLAGSVPATAQIVIPNVPLNDSQSSPPIVMLVASKDHKLFFEAYNDAIDLDGDGKIDVGFKPHIVYYGLFDSKLCYEGRGRNSGGSLSNSSYSKTADFFDPVAPVTNMERHTCSGGRWSGNFLNYVTTSRIDALRKVLYGGLRSDDPTSSNTILRRAYIPKDGHAWGKEYTSVAVDGYNIADYTPFSIP